MIDASTEDPSPDTPGASSPAEPTVSSAAQPLCWALIAVTIGMYIVRFVRDRGLWLDEAYLALNIIHRSFVDLTTELDYEQYAPFGFLFAVKALVLALGSSEYVFRLLPLLGAVATVFLYFALARRILYPGAVPWSLAILAVSHPFPIYAAEAKPYGTDATIALALTLLGLATASRGRIRVVDGAILAGSGAAAVWFSYPSVFVLTGIGLTLGTESLARRDWRRTGLLLLVGAAWLISLGVNASIIRGDGNAQLSASDLQHLRAYYSDEFLPWPPTPAPVAEWLMHFVPNTLGYFTSDLAAGVAVFAFLMGCIAFISNRRRELCMLVLPIIAAILVSATRLYPLGDRFLMFTGPALLLVVAAGFDEIRSRIGARGRLIWVLLLAVIFFQPTLRAIKQTISPDRFGDARPVIARLDESVERDDTIYLHWSGVPLYRLYSTNPVPDAQIIEGSRSGSGDRWATNAEDLGLLYGSPRVWIVFTFNAHNSGSGQTIRDELDRRGCLLDSFEHDRAAIYLYDLSEGSGPGAP